MTRKPANEAERNPELLAMLDRIAAMVEAEITAFAAAHDGAEPDLFLLISHGADMETYTSTDDFNTLSDDLETVITDWIELGLVTLDGDAPPPPPRLQ